MSFIFILANIYNNLEKKEYLKLMKRPREHVLETESRKAFEQMIPDEWVCRELHPDYGIDYQIEIFSDNFSTGNMFYVQIKGTDKKPINEIIGLNIEISYFRYYSYLPLPILFVLYSSKTKEFWGIWANKLLSTRKLKKNQKYIKIKFDYSTKINQDFFEHIQSSLTSNYHYNKSLFFKADGSYESKKFCTILNNWLDILFPNTFIYEDYKLPTYTTYRIRIDHQKFVINVEDSETGNFQSIINLKKEDRDFIDYPIYDDKKIPLQLQEIFFITSMLLLDRVPRESLNIFKNIILTYNGKYKSPLNIFHITYHFLINSFYLDFNEIIDECINQEKWDDFQIYSLSLVLYQEKKELDLDKLRDIYQNNLFKAISKVADKTLKSIFSYNLANSIRSNHKPQYVFSWYLKAKRLNSDYLNMDYWWMEVAGTLFHSEHYICAANCYKKACNISNNYEPHILALTADSLFMARKIEESMSWFEKHFSKSNIPTSEWLLKYKACKFLTSNSLPKNKLDKKYSQNLATQAINNQHIKLEDQINELVKAIEYDPLCCLAWYNYALIYGNESYYSYAMIGFIMCALGCNNRNAWVNALFMAFIDYNYFVFLLIADTIYSKFGKSIFYDISAVIKDQQHMSQTDKEMLYDRITDLFDQIDKTGTVLKEPPDLSTL